MDTDQKAMSEEMPSTNNNDININDHGYQFPSINESQTVKLLALTKNMSTSIFETAEYLNLIPGTKDPNWIYTKPNINFTLNQTKNHNHNHNRPHKHGINGHNASNEQLLAAHESMMDSFKTIPDFEAHHAYSSYVQRALNTFHIWRKWKNNALQNRGWTLKTTKSDLNIYCHSLENEPIDILKGEAIIPFSPSIIAGVLLNEQHQKQWDRKLENVVKVKTLSANSTLVYVSCNTPSRFISQRDLFLIVFVFAFGEDGTVLIGSTSVDSASPQLQRVLGAAEHRKFGAMINNTATYVRATTNLNMWYIRPDYECAQSSNGSGGGGDLGTTSRVTYFAHANLGGSLPNYIINKASMDMPTSILKLRKYMCQRITGELHQKGSLNIPPYPLLHILGIDVGRLFLPESVRRRRRRARDGSSDEESGDSDENVDEDEEEQEIKENIVVDTDMDMEMEGMHENGRTKNPMLILMSYADMIKKRMKEYEKKFAINEKQVLKFRNLNTDLKRRIKALENEKLALMNTLNDRNRNGNQKHSKRNILVFVVVFCLIVGGCVILWRRRRNKAMKK